MNASLQAGNSIPKWDQRARLGVNLGPSPNHARSASVILNQTSEFVSPQFHIIHNDFFETVRSSATDEKSLSLWQILSGFSNDRLDKPEGAQSLNITNPSDTQFTHEEIKSPSKTQDGPLPEGESTEIHDNLVHTAQNDLTPLSTGARRLTRVGIPTRGMLDSIA